jgi:hypothetical protein
LFKPNSFIGRLISFIVASLKDLANYTILLCFFILIFALAGRELFGKKITLINRKDKFNYNNPNTLSPRENFDNVGSAFITVFILFIGDV